MEKEIIENVKHYIDCDNIDIDLENNKVTVDKITINLPAFKGNPQDIADVIIEGIHFSKQLQEDNYDNIKESLYVVLVNTKNSGKYPIKRQLFNDIQIVPKIFIKNDKDSVQSSVINEGFLSRFNVSEQQIIDDAIENTAYIMDVDFMNMFTLRSDMADILPDDILPEFDFPMYVLSNKKRIYGASIILNTNVMNMIAAKLNDDFIVLPSSIHEVIIIPMSACITGGPSNMIDMVREVNKEVLMPDEILSDYPMYYSQSSKKLSLLADNNEVNE